MAEAVTGGASPALLASLHALDRPSGAIGPTVNSTIWGMLALRQAGQPVDAATVRYVEKTQARNGGFAWATRHPAGQRRHRGRRRGARRRRSARLRPHARARVPARPRDEGRRLRAPARLRLERPVDGVVDPGVPRRRCEAARRRLPLPRADDARRRQPPLLGAVRDDAAVGLGAGAARAVAKAVPAADDRRRGSALRLRRRARRLGGERRARLAALGDGARPRRGRRRRDRARQAHRGHAASTSASRTTSPPRWSASKAQRSPTRRASPRTRRRRRCCRLFRRRRGRW